MYTQQNVERNHVGIYPDHLDDQRMINQELTTWPAGPAFHCLLSESPWQRQANGVNSAGYSAAGTSWTQGQQEGQKMETAEIWKTLLGQKLSGVSNPRQPQKKSRRMMLMNEIQDHCRCIKPSCKEIQRMNVIIILAGGVGLPPSMDTRGKQLENPFAMLIFQLQTKSFPIFSCAMILLYYSNVDTHTHTYTHTDTNMAAACFSRVPCVRSQGN